MPAGAHHSCAGRHRDENGEHARVERDLGSWPRGHDRGAGPARRCRAPCAPGSSRAAARRTPRLRSRQPARPGTGSGARGVRARAGRPRSHGTGTGPASCTRRTRRRAPDPARRRSLRHHVPTSPGTRAARLRRLWIATADTELRTARRSAGVGRCLDLGRRTGPAAVAAEGVEPLVRRDQVHGQVCVRRDDHRLRCTTEHTGLDEGRHGRRPVGGDEADLLASAEDRLSTARVAGSRQPMSTIRSASASPAEKDCARPVPETMPSSVRRMSMTCRRGAGLPA